MDHVRTQIPYALLVGMAALVIGTIPAGFGVPWFLLVPSGAVVLVVVLRFMGKESEA
jgi:Na+/H+ antiporter NhaC